MELLSILGRLSAFKVEKFFWFASRTIIVRVSFSFCVFHGDIFHCLGKWLLFPGAVEELMTPFLMSGQSLPIFSVPERAGMWF